MKKITLVFLSMIIMLSFISKPFADDDRNRKKRDTKVPPVGKVEIDDDRNTSTGIEFVYDKNNIGNGAVESGHYFTGPSGKVYLFPYWANTNPTPTPTPIPTPTPTPVPVITPSKANAFNSCVQCHKSTDSKYTFEKWTTTLHQKTGHKSKSCTVCHNLVG